jgi:peptidoglycan/LPS O-acetylase OafA/YrhL
MSTEDKRRDFDDIVDHLAADYPSLVRPPWPRWPRPVLITVSICCAVVWALLSVAMVAWGLAGVALTCVIVAACAVAGVLDARHGPGRPSQ